MEQWEIMLKTLNFVDERLSGDHMDPIEADLNRELVKRENAALIREKAEYAVLSRFKFFGPDPEELMEAVSNMSQEHWGELRGYFRTKDDASLGELIRRLTEDQAVEAEIEAGT